MKGYLAFLLLVLVACAQPGSTGDASSMESEQITATPADEEVSHDTDKGREEVGTLVYVTDDGGKYHTADCRYAATAHPVKLATAKADGKTACGVCKPNSKTGEKQTRCSGVTSEGKQCQRMTTDPSGKCFQHRGS